MKSHHIFKSATWHFNRNLCTAKGREMLQSLAIGCFFCKSEHSILYSRSDTESVGLGRPESMGSIFLPTLLIVHRRVFIGQKNC